MRVVACPDKFRGTASAPEVAAAVAAAVEAAGGSCVRIPLADGGEGTVDAFGGPNRETEVTGPLGQPVRAGWRLGEDGVAVIEAARACGLVLAGGASGNDPVAATTRGVGELIAAAVAEGARRVLIGVGGSATTDGGAGAVAALAEAGVLATVVVEPEPSVPAQPGVLSRTRGRTDRGALAESGDSTVSVEPKSSDLAEPGVLSRARGRTDRGALAESGDSTVSVEPKSSDLAEPGLLSRARGQTDPGALAGLGDSAGIDVPAGPDARPDACVGIIVCCDVRTPFTAAAEVFAPQKGATAQQIALLTARLQDLRADILARTGIDLDDIPGSGAAGGLAGGLAALGARLVPGFDAIAAQVGLEAALAGADLVVTGEGRLDATSLDGKVVGGVLAMCRAAGKSALVVCGAAATDPGVPVADLSARFGPDRSWSDTLACITEAVAAHLAALR